jgi:hypothetical protein
MHCHRRHHWLAGICLLVASLGRIAAAQTGPRDRAANQRVDEAMQTLFRQGAFEETESQLLATLTACGDQCTPSVRARIWMYVGIVRADGRHKSKLATEAFDAAVNLHPGVELDRTIASAETVSLFVKAGGRVADAAPFPANATEQKASTTCVPDCRSGFVCVDGQCVSACNPPCAATEVCTAQGSCVPGSMPPPAIAAPAPTPTQPPAQAPAAAPGAPAPVTPAPGSPATIAGAPSQLVAEKEEYAYSRLRIIVGGGVGFGFAPDGTGFAFGLVGGLAYPFGGTWYGRGELLYSRFTTGTDDEYYVGGVGYPYATTYVDSVHSLIALRAMVGKEFTSLLGARAGVLVGARTLHVEHGLCGSSYAEDDFVSTALGVAGALTLNVSSTELAVTFDAYSAKTQAYCETTLGGGGYGTLVDTEKLGMQLLAQGTYLF